MDQPKMTSPFRALLSLEASPALPRLSNAQMLDAPENRAIRDIWVLAPDDASLHAGRKIAVIATDGVEEIELTTVLHYFRSRGARVDLVAPEVPSYPDFLGVQVPAIRATHILTITFIAPGGWIKFDRHLDEVTANDYDVVIIPGGVWNPDSLRNDAKVIDFVRAAAAANKIVSAICHGPWILSDAGLLRGKRAAGWWAIKPDLENAGASFVDEPAVTDGRIVTARAPIDLAAFVHAIDALLVAI
jgi:protease I